MESRLESGMRNHRRIFLKALSFCAFWEGKIGVSYTTDGWRSEREIKEDGSEQLSSPTHLLDSALTPGKSLPSSSSKDAPPPVET